MTLDGRRLRRILPDVGIWVSPRLLETRVGRQARPRVLLLCHFREDDAATIYDHIAAIRDLSTNDVFVLCSLGDLPDDLDLNAFDAIVIHYSVVVASDGALTALARWRIAHSRGTKAAFVQDEYRWVDETVAALHALRVEVLFTCVPEGDVALVYPAEKLPCLRRTVTVLTGYVPEGLLELPVPGYRQRRTDVGYRARSLPFWLGRLAQEKAWICDRFQADADRFGLTVDLSRAEEDRLYGPDWTAFLSRCKGVLGTESGASVFDFDGSLERSVRAYLDTHEDADFDDVEPLLRDAEGLVTLNQISPRCFEAAALGTLMILYEGHYSGILEPWRHYVPLRKDHGNVREVVEALRDEEAWSRITRAARREVAENPAYGYPGLVEQFDGALALQTPEGPPVPVRGFARVAHRTVNRLAYRRPVAYGLPRWLGQARERLASAAAFAALDPVPVATSASRRGAERLHPLRDRTRLMKAWLYWVSQPRRVGARSLRRGGRPLLEQLGLLVSLQRMGRRSPERPPYTLLTNELGAMVTAADQGSVAATAPPAGTFSVDLPPGTLRPPEWRGLTVTDLPALASLLTGDRRRAAALLLGRGGQPWSQLVAAARDSDQPG